MNFPTTVVIFFMDTHKNDVSERSMIPVSPMVGKKHFQCVTCQFKWRISVHVIDILVTVNFSLEL